MDDLAGNSTIFWECLSIGNFFLYAPSWSTIIQTYILFSNMQKVVQKLLNC